MRRREVIAAFGWTLFLTGHSTAVAQQSPSRRAGVVDQKLVGVLYRGGGYSTQLDSFRDELRRAGLREGAHLRIDIRELTGNLQTVQDAARAPRKFRCGCARRFRSIARLGRSAEHKHDSDCFHDRQGSSGTRTY